MKVKLNNKTYDIPTGYATLSWGKYIDIRDALTDLELVARFTGMPYNELEKLTDFKGYYQILAGLRFLTKQPPIERRPELVTPMGRIYSLPSSFEKVGLDQYEDIKGWLQKEDITDEERITTIVAIGAMKSIRGVYNSEMIDEVKEIIKTCTVTSVSGTYGFFLRNWNASKHGTMKAWLDKNIPLRKLWQDLRTWIGLVSLIFCLA